jgi:hypothetical protein
MDGLTLLDRAREAGLTLGLEGDLLVIEGPRRAEAIARELLAHKAEIVALLSPPESPTEPTKPDPHAHLVGPRSTPWGTWAWSDPTAPEIEAFGPLLRGVVVDQPDRARMLAALRAADPADPDALEERRAIRAESRGEEHADGRTPLAQG